MNYSNLFGDECLIWPGHAAKTYNEEDGRNGYFVEYSPRAGGSYSLAREAKHMLDEFDAHAREKITTKITTRLVDQRRLGNAIPRVTTTIIEEAKAARDITADERAERLLGFLAQQTTNLGSAVGVAIMRPWADVTFFTTEYDIACHAKAISESVEFDELVFLLQYLEVAGWIQMANSGAGTVGCTVTVDGYRQIAEQEVNPSSDRVFIAMWFDDSMVDAREDGIKPAILNTGYTPRLINEKPDVDKIDDEIIGEIRRSRFLVADFTHGDRGARGGVYYEAGFALGIGLTVIRSCRKDVIDRNELHFDVRQHYHIVWETPDELRIGLEARILALVGEGPNRENIPPSDVS